MKVAAIIGLDLSAYADIDLEVPDGASKEEIIELVRAFLDSDAGEELNFSEDWSTACAQRIVSAMSGNDYLLDDVALEPSPFDAGQGFMNWLRGYVPLQAAINGAVSAGIIAPIQMEVHHGALKLPGAEAIELNFECRKGATREEKDLAFMEALAQLGTIDYVEIGALNACDDCGQQTDGIIGCPDGAEVCQACFDAGRH